MRPRLCLRHRHRRPSVRARSVYAGCIRVGEVRDPRVITGLSRGTYINPSSPSTYIFAARRCAGARRIFTRDNVTLNYRSFATEKISPFHSFSIPYFIFYLRLFSSSSSRNIYFPHYASFCLFSFNISHIDCLSKSVGK